MPPRAHGPIVDSFVEELTAARSRDEAERALLHALVRLELGSAVALCRGGRDTDWRATRSSGAVERLPDAAGLAALAAAPDDAALPVGLLHVRAPRAHLLVADCRPDSAQAELVHALFLVWCSADDAEPRAALEAAALPAQRPRPAATLVELLRASCGGTPLHLEGLSARSVSTAATPGLVQILDEVLAPIRGDASAKVRVFDSRGPHAGIVLVIESSAAALARTAPASLGRSGWSWRADATPSGGSRCQLWLPAA